MQGRSERKEVATQIRTIAHAIVLMMIAILLGIVPESIVAYHSDVLFDYQVREKVLGLDHSPEAVKQLKEYEERKELLTRSLQELEHKIALAPPANISEMVTSHAQLDSYLKGMKPPIAVNGYYLGHTMFAWPTIIAMLLWLIFLFDGGIPRSLVRPREMLRTFFAALGLHVTYNWTIWMRNFVLPQTGRKVFVTENVDISWGCFLAQEWNTLVFAFLMAFAWRCWTRRAEARIQEFAAIGDPAAAVLGPSLFQRTAAEFLQWQVASAILMIGFVIFTATFWDLIIAKDDHRYLIAGFTVHLFWAASWFLLSQPLFETWKAWQRTKHAALAVLLTSDVAGAKDTAKLIGKLSPVNNTNIIASGFAAIASFSWPILQSLFK